MASNIANKAKVRFPEKFFIFVIIV